MIFFLKKKTVGLFLFWGKQNPNTINLPENILKKGKNIIAIRLIDNWGSNGDFYKIKDMIANLRIVVNPDDDAAIERTINNPPRGNGQKTIDIIPMTAPPPQKETGHRLLSRIM